MKQFNDYLLIKPSSQTQLNLNYQIATSQIINFYQILNYYVLQNGLLNSLGQYLPSSPTVVLPLNTNYTINSTQIVDFNTQLQNYLLVQPKTQTALNTNYTIKQSQITDLAPADIRNYLPLNPITQITSSSKYTITESQISNNTITASQIAANTILLQKLFPDLVTLILQHRIYVHYITDTGRILQIDETGSVYQFAYQLKISGGSLIGTAYCYTGFGGFMHTINSNVNSVNYQQSPSSVIQLDTTKILNDAGCYGMHFNNTYYNLSLFMGFCGQQPWVIGGNYSCCFFAMNTSPAIYIILVIQIKINNKIFKRRQIIKINQIKFQNQTQSLTHMIQIIQKEYKNYNNFCKMKILQMKKEKKFKKIFFKYKYSNLKHYKVSPIKTFKNVDLVTFQIINR